MSTVTKPIALDETLQSTNTALSSLGKDTTLQAIATAIANVGLSNIGNLSSLATTDKTSLVSAINEVVGDVSDLDTDKADKVTSATNGNLAGLNASGNLTDSGWASDKTTTSASGNPISITGLKSNQLAVNPVITFEPIQDLHGQSNPYPAGGGKNLLPMTVEGIKNGNSGTWSGNSIVLGNVTFTILTDSANNVIGIKANGTANAEANLNLYNSTTDFLTVGISYTITPSSGNLRLLNPTWKYSNVNPTFTAENMSGVARRVQITVNSGVTLTNQIFYPMIRLASITDSTFAPYTNICPISGYDKIEVLSCGKNIWNDDAVSGQSQMSQNGRTYTSTITDSRNYVNLRVVLMNGSTLVRKASINTNITTAGRYSGVIGVASGEKVTTIVLGHTGASKDIGVAYTLQAPITKVCTLAVSVDVTSANPSTVGGFVMKDIQLEENTSATTYTPINKTTDLFENLPQTVYGGTLDLRTGKFTVEFVKKVYDGSSDETWTKDGQSFYIAENTLPKELTYTTNIIKCDRLKTVERSSLIGTGEVTNAISGYKDTSSSYPNQNWIYIGISGISDVASLKTWLSNNPIEVTFKVINSAQITIQLTPHEISLLKDYAYVSTNGTSMSFDYHNGEIATLGDVSQLGETVNELGNIVGKLIKIDTVDIAVGNNKITTSYKSADYVLISAIQINSNTSVAGTVRAYIDNGYWVIQTDSVQVNTAKIRLLFTANM